MKQWWLGLAQREKQIVTLGGIAVILFMIYTCIWLPLDHKITAMRAEIVQNQKLYTWMEAADRQLKTAQAPTAHSSASALSLTQNLIKQSSFANQLSQLRQAENDAVLLSFKQVNFDELITWLNDASRQQGLAVTQFTVAASTTPGIVSAEIQLTQS